MKWLKKAFWVKFTSLDIHMAMRPPWWMGMAWWNFDSDTRVCIILPFNWPARWIREGWFRLKCPRKKLLCEQYIPRVDYHRKLEEVRREGFGDGYDTCMRVTKDMRENARKCIERLNAKEGGEPNGGRPEGEDI